MHNLKIAFRNLKRNGSYSLINVLGLSIGMAAALLLFFWIYNEWSYDRFHQKEKQLYQVWDRADLGEKLECWDWTPRILGPTLKADFPDIVETTRNQRTEFTVASGDKKFKIQTSAVDPGFLTMFSFPLLEGDQKSALNEVNSVILTQKAAKRLFGDENPVGKSILIENSNQMIVTGLMKDLPSNTKFDFEALVPMEFMKKLGSYDENWGNNSTATYVELRPGAKEEDVNKLIGGTIRKYSNNDVKIDIFLHPAGKWHLYSTFENGKITGGLIDMLKLFSLVGILILLVACINFMNLSTARSEKRAKEVGLRKVLGAKRLSLIVQFMAESNLLAVVSGIIAFLLVWILMPSFSQFMGKSLNIDLANPTIWIIGISAILLTGILAGSYPAFYLSAFLPIKVLKGTFKSGHSLIAPRKILVVLQFTFAVFLILSSWMINRQIHYAQQRDSGYNKDQLIYHPTTGDIEKNFELIRHDLLESGVALSVTKTSAPMTEGWSNTWGYEWKGKNPNDRTIVDQYYVDANWAKTVGATIIQGRDIDIYNFPTDSSAMLLNESAVKLMGFEQPLGEIVKGQGHDWHVVGVIKDFILHSPYSNTIPMVIGGPYGWYNAVHIKLNGANKMSENLAKVEQIFKQYNPNFLFESHFIDEEYAKKFNDEKRMGNLASCFMVLTIFISCMGLFALVAYMAETRKKEIGIRKVLGASIKDIVTLLSKEFAVLVMISIVVASAIAWWAINKWLQTYPFHTDFPWWIFIIVGVIMLSIALITVSLQAIKAATSDPVKSIKTE